MTRLAAAAAVLLTLSTLVNRASCFTTSSGGWNRRPPAAFGTLQQVLQATVYHGDESSFSYFDEESSSPGNYLNQEGFQNMFQSHMADLARLAVAFSPTSLDIQNIHHLEVLELDEVHMDVQAVVCEDDGCVTLKVPLEFPHPCQNVQEDCVLDNMELLEKQAEQTKMQQTQQDPLVLRDQMSLPQWWVSPEYTIAEECNDLVSLLNQDDFAFDVKALATHVLKKEQDAVVQQAKVLAVGPAGIHLLVLLASDEVQQLQVTHAFHTAENEMESLHMEIVNALTVAVNAMELKP